jgi:pyruvate dehydrogenase E2 component (dihydrolipoamide acetyltransferase)
MTDGARQADIRPDFSEFGATETIALSKIQQIGGRVLARNWAEIPHVTHQDEADVTEFELRRAKGGAGESAERPSALAFYAKAVAVALAEFPKFNASLDVARGELILKRYYHIGFAIDTPNGLVVGVVRDCDRKTAGEIGREISALAAKARARGLSYAEMTGGSFTISSLGANGGTGFSPIINAPEVAILGLSRVLERPVRGPSGEVLWRRMLPLSLSYDHRVINGADAARFTTRLRNLIAEPASFGRAAEADA